MRQPLVDDALHESVHFGVAERVFRLPLKLRIRDANADDSGHPFADVVAGDLQLHIVHQPRIVRVFVEGAGERRFEAADMRPAVARVDAVDIGVDHLFAVGVVELERRFNLGVGAFTGDIDRFFMKRLFAVVQMFNKFDDAVFVVKFPRVARLTVGMFAFVCENDADAAVQKGKLAQARRKRLKTELKNGEDVGVG